MHTYPAGAYASDEARNWLERTDVGCDTAENVAVQMEGFAVSGLSKRVKKIRDGAHWFPIHWYLTLICYIRHCKACADNCSR